MFKRVDMVGKLPDLATTLGLTNPNSTPFMTNLMNLGKVRGIGDYTTTWVDYTVANLKTYLNGAIDNAVTSVTVDDGSVFANVKYIRVDNEVMSITSIATNVLTVVRGVLGTSAASHLDNNPVYTVSSGFAEGGAFVNEAVKKGTKYENYCQIESTKLELSNTAKALFMPSADGKTAWELEYETKMRKHEAKMEAVIVNGQRYDDRATSGVSTSGGIGFFLNSGTIYNHSGAALTKAAFDELIAAIYELDSDLEAGGYAWCMSPKTKIKLSNILKDYIPTEPVTNGIIGQVAGYIANDFTNSPLPMLVSKNIDNDEIWLVNFNDIEINPLGLNGNRMLEYIEGNDGDDDKKSATFVSEFTITSRKIPTMGKIINFV